MGKLVFMVTWIFREKIKFLNLFRPQKWVIVLIINRLVDRRSNFTYLKSKHRGRGRNIKITIISINKTNKPRSGNASKTRERHNTLNARRLLWIEWRKWRHPLSPPPRLTPPLARRSGNFSRTENFSNPTPAACYLLRDYLFWSLIKESLSVYMRRVRVYRAVSNSSDV